MYVCVCNPVSDKQIAQAAREGACCMRDLRDRLGVGARCGKCVPMAKELLQVHGTGGGGGAGSGRGLSAPQP